MAAVEDEKSRLRTYINDRLNRTGEREKLKDLLRTRLNECGWREELKNHCRGFLRDKNKNHYIQCNFNTVVCTKSELRGCLGQGVTGILELPSSIIEIIRTKGLENLTVDDLVAEITPVGRRMIPDAVKQELLDEIRSFLNREADL